MQHQSPLQTSFIKEDSIRLGRRKEWRFKCHIPVILRCKSKNEAMTCLSGVTDTISLNGITCRFIKTLPCDTKYVYLTLIPNDASIDISGPIIWQDRERLACGIAINNPSIEWKQFASNFNDHTFIVTDRRLKPRRERTTDLSGTDLRKGDRRFDDLNRVLLSEDQNDGLLIKKFMRNKGVAYSNEIIAARRQWISDLTKTRLRHISTYSESSEDFKGKIENPIGVAHTPLGLAGPLKINGEYAKGMFYIPMATTEGALITSYTFGSTIATRSGGINVKILKDELKSDPSFIFKTFREAQVFLSWLDKNFRRICEIAESTSHHLKLIKLRPLINGRRVILIFHWDTGDAMGMNMAYKATDAACKMIKECVKPEEFWLHSNYTSIKKTTAANFINGYGKTISTDVIIPRKIVELLGTTPEDMERYFLRTLLGSAQGILFGISAHMANALAAISIACGQDAALVSNSHGATITCETTKSGDLYYSALFPSILAASIGGGTSFGTSRECLELLGCYGNGKSKRLAEIIAATALAGEISLMVSVVNGTYIAAHETFGRNPPK